MFPRRKGQGQIIRRSWKSRARRPAVDAQHANLAPHRQGQSALVVDVQIIARRDDLDPMLARRLERIGELDLGRSARRDSDLLPRDSPAIDQQIDLLPGPGLAAEISQLGPQHGGATGQNRRIGRLQIDDRQIVGARASHVKDDQGRRFCQPVRLPEELGPGRRGQFWRPRRALQVGEKDDFLPVETGIMPAGPFDEPADLRDGRRQFGGLGRGLQIIEPAENGRVVQVGSDNQLRPTGHQHQRKGVAGRAFGDDLPGNLFRPIEARLAGRFVGHRERAVEDQYAVSALAGRQGHARRADVGFGDGRHHQHDEQGADGRAGAIARRGFAATGVERPPGGFPSPPREFPAAFAASADESGSAQPPPPASRASAG